MPLWQSMAKTKQRRRVQSQRFAISWRTGELNSGIVATLCGLWGGALLLLCVKRVADATKEKGEKINDDIDGPTI